METKTYKDVLQLKQYRKLLISDVVSRFGDSVDAIAFSWLAYTLSGDAKWSAVVFTVNLLPTILFQPFTGAFVERMKKKNIMVICDLIRFALVTLCVALLLLQVLNPWILLGITFLNSTVEAIRMPASTAIIPELVDEEYYEASTSLTSSSSRLMELLGSGVSGVLIAIFGVPIAMMIDAATFLISAISLSTIQTKEVEVVEKQQSKYSEDLLSGFKYIGKHKLFLFISFIAIVVNFLMAPFNALLSPFVAEVLHGQSDYLSYISISTSLGMLIGSFIYPKISKRISFQSLIVFPLSILGFYYIGMASLGQIYSNVILTLIVLVTLNFFFGFCVAVLNTAVMVKFMKVVDPKYLARVSAAFMAACTLAMPISSGLSSIGVNFVSISNLFIILGSVTTALMILFGWKLHSKIKQLDKEYDTSSEQVAPVVLEEVLN